MDADSALLESITRPVNLPKKFPFPDPDGSEQRDRPAYYYTQSSVIPYRVHNGRVEILVIASSKKKHLVVPKGIKDPGLTPQASAAKEAWEEAGVEGEVATEPLGEYRYEKWGGICTVTVYPMKVTRMVPEDEREESDGKETGRRRTSRGASLASEERGGGKAVVSGLLDTSEGRVCRHAGVLCRPTTLLRRVFICRRS